MPELDGLQATQRIRRLEEKSAAQRGISAAEPEAAAACCDARRSGAAGGVTGQVARVPIIAVSSCSETDQLLSPALANVDTTTGAPSGVKRAVLPVHQQSQDCTTHRGLALHFCTFVVLGWSMESRLPTQTATSACPSRAVCLEPATRTKNPHLNGRAAVEGVRHGLLARQAGQPGQAARCAGAPGGRRAGAARLERGRSGLRPARRRGRGRRGRRPEPAGAVLAAAAGLWRRGPGSGAGRQADRGLPALHTSE